MSVPQETALAPPQAALTAPEGAAAEED